MPIAKATYEGNHIVPFRTDSGFEEPFVPSILYDGVMATEEEASYSIPMPSNPTDAKTVSDKVLAIAKQFMEDKQ